MRFVVLREDETPPKISTQCVPHFAGKVQLLLQPHRDRLEEGTDAEWSGHHIGLQESLELEKRLVVEANVIEVGGGEPGFLEAIRDRPSGKSSIVLDPGEAFFLSRGHDPAVDEQDSR